MTATSAPLMPTATNPQAPSRVAAREVSTTKVTKPRRREAPARSAAGPNRRTASRSASARVLPAARSCAGGGREMVLRLVQQPARRPRVRPEPQEQLVQVVLDRRVVAVAGHDSTACMCATYPCQSRRCAANCWLPAVVSA